MGRQVSMAQLHGLSFVLTEEEKTSALCVKLQLKSRPRTPPVWALLGTRDSVNRAFPSSNFPIISCHTLTWTKTPEKITSMKYAEITLLQKLIQLNRRISIRSVRFMSTLESAPIGLHRSPWSAVCTMNHIISTEITWGSTAGKGKQFGSTQENNYF